MAAGGVTTVVNGFGNRTMAAGGGRTILIPINGMVVPDRMDSVPIIHRTAGGGLCPARMVVAVTISVFRPNGVIAVSME
jgi:hypothetical protein